MKQFSNEVMNPKIQLSQTKPFACEKCETDTFDLCYMLRRVPALMSPTGQESIVPMGIFRCSECKYVNPEQLPENN